MYALVYVDPDTIPLEDYFPDTTTVVDNCKKCQLQDQSQNVGFDLVTCV